MEKENHCIDQNPSRKQMACSNEVIEEEFGEGLDYLQS